MSTPTTRERVREGTRTAFDRVDGTLSASDGTRYWTSAVSGANHTFQGVSALLRLDFGALGRVYDAYLDERHGFDVVKDTFYRVVGPWDQRIRDDIEEMKLANGGRLTPEAAARAWVHIARTSIYSHRDPARAYKKLTGENFDPSRIAGHLAVAKSNPKIRKQMRQAQVAIDRALARQATQAERSGTSLLRTIRWHGSRKLDPTLMSQMRDICADAGQAHRRPIDVQDIRDMSRRIGAAATAAAAYLDNYVEYRRLMDRLDQDARNYRDEWREQNRQEREQRRRERQPAPDGTGDPGSEHGQEGPRRVTPEQGPRPRNPDAERVRAERVERQQTYRDERTGRITDPSLFANAVQAEQHRVHQLLESLPEGERSNFLAGMAAAAGVRVNWSDPQLRHDATTLAGGRHVINQIADPRQLRVHGDVLRAALGGFAERYGVDMGNGPKMSYFGSAKREAPKTGDWATLGATHGTEDERWAQAKKAYREAGQAGHPDIKGASEGARQRFEEVKAAYKRLEGERLAAQRARDAAQEVIDHYGGKANGTTAPTPDHAAPAPDQTTPTAATPTAATPTAATPTAATPDKGTVDGASAASATNAPGTSRPTSTAGVGTDGLTAGSNGAVKSPSRASSTTATTSTNGGDTVDGSAAKDAGGPNTNTAGDESPGKSRLSSSPPRMGLKSGDGRSATPSEATGGANGQDKETTVTGRDGSEKPTAKPAKPTATSGRRDGGSAPATSDTGSAKGQGQGQPEAGTPDRGPRGATSPPRSRARAPRGLRSPRASAPSSSRSAKDTSPSTQGAPPRRDSEGAPTGSGRGHRTPPKATVKGPPDAAPPSPRNPSPRAERPTSSPPTATPPSRRPGPAGPGGPAGGIGG